MVKKKPVLKLVTATAPSPAAPPRTLGESGLTLWQTIMAEYDIADSGGREMLLQARCTVLQG
jgi:hypothetical protein